VPLWPRKYENSDKVCKYGRISPIKLVFAKKWSAVCNHWSRFQTYLKKYFYYYINTLSLQLVAYFVSFLRKCRFKEKPYVLLVKMKEWTCTWFDWQSYVSLNSIHILSSLSKIWKHKNTCVYEERCRKRLMVTIYENVSLEVSGFAREKNLDYTLRALSICYLSQTV
jgi:hypothetical protein